MIVGVVRESRPGERRVALVPAALPALTKAGWTVLVESGAGEAAGFPDAGYLDKGARILDGRAQVLAEAHVMTVVHAPEELEGWRSGQTVLGLLDPLGAPRSMERLAQHGLTAIALELVPRTTKAQSMDALSSMATIAGYKAVILAAAELPRLFPLLMTAAGTVTPARVLVIGAGVAGLQAIGTARRLGAVVSAYDVRPAVKTEVESVGARFVALPLEAAGAQDQGGYARAQEESFYKRQRELLAEVIAQQDVVITTAAVPGRRAPLLVTREAALGMPRGSVVVDLAAERGGNCELTRPGEAVIEEGVTILAPLDLPASVPYHASQLYARNLAALLLHLTREGNLRWDSEDAILRDTLVAHGGEVRSARLRELLSSPGKGEAS